MLQNLFLIRKKFVPVKFIGHISSIFQPVKIFHNPMWNFQTTSRRNLDVSTQETPTTDVSGGWFFQCCIPSFGGIIKTVAQIMCPTKTKYNSTELTSQFCRGMS